MAESLTFNAPGPGPWELDTAHFPRPMTPFVAEAFCGAFAAGFAEGAAQFGLLLSHLKPAVVNGFFYIQPVAFGAPEGAMGPPPKPVLWLLTRLHPKMRARIAECERAFRDKRWRDELRLWDEVKKPRAIAAHLALQRVDPESLDTAGLAAHVERCFEHLGDMLRLHHRFTIPCVLVTGDLLAHAQEWSGATAGEVLELLRGSSQISNGVAAEELTSLGDAIKASDEAQRLLASDAEPGSLIESLSALDGPVGSATRAYYEMVRYRSLGYDVADRTAGEMPEILVKAIRAAVAGAREKADDGREAKLRALRERIPEAHRAAFDELLGEARTMNRLRDERGVFSDGWATGLARRALLVAGGRLVASGKLDTAEQAADLSLSELVEQLRGEGEPLLEELRRRVEHRKTKTAADAPPWLNAPPAPPPSPDLLPPAARRAARAVDSALFNVLKESEAPNSRDVLRGLSVNGGVHEGTARLVLDATEFSRLQQGDVLVTRATSPYFNVVLPLLGAIVTDRGGQLSHAAIVAREYGIPAVVGTREATTRIPDGALVRVDGSSGEVTVLKRPASA